MAEVRKQEKALRHQMREEQDDKQRIIDSLKEQLEDKKKRD